MLSPDKLTFESLVKTYRRPMTSAAYHLCNDREAALDIVQETLIDACRGFDGLRDPAKAGAWLYAILRRKAIAYRRSRRTYAELVTDCASAEPDDAGELVRDIVIEQMVKLSEQDREILAGKYLLGLSYKELADSLGVKEGVIRVRCFRAKERLREILSSSGVNITKQDDRAGLGNR
jgi:RNA polymerase sigma-70 factor (ECF subfamily)